MNVLKEAKEGFSATADTKCPYLDSSPASLAWHAGAWMQSTGRSEPRKCTTSRGYTLRVNDMLVEVSDSANIKRIN